MVKPEITVLLYAALSREIRYCAMTKGYNIEAPNIYDLSRTKYQELRKQTLYHYSKIRSLDKSVNTILERLKCLLEQNFETKQVEFFYETGEQIAQIINVSKNKKVKKPLIKLISMLDAAYLFAVNPASNIKKTEEQSTHIKRQGMSYQPAERLRLRSR
ncbi:MAG: hypothetical protein ACKVE4_10470 [Dissulfuribacterales bacterium]